MKLADILTEASVDKTFKRGDEVLHRKKGSHGKVLKKLPDNNYKVRWAFTKSSSEVNGNEIISLPKGTKNQK